MLCPQPDSDLRRPHASLPSDGLVITISPPNACDCERICDVFVQYMNLIGSAMGIVLDMAFNSKEIGTKTTVTCALSNAGLIPANEGFGPWKLIRVRPVVNMAYARYPTLLIETAAGHLTVTILSPSEYISDGDAEALMSEMMSALQTLIGGGTIQQDEDNMVTTLNL